MSDVLGSEVEEAAMHATVILLLTHDTTISSGWSANTR